MEQPSSSSRRREWIARALFESGLIVLGLIGAVALNDWHDRRQRDEKVRGALASIRMEVQSNLESITGVIAFNEKLIGLLTESAKTGKPYMGPIVQGMSLYPTAWDATRDAGILSDIPFPTLMSLGHAYTAQARFVREIEFFMNQVYTGNVGVDLRKNPNILRGILNDYTSHARGLRQNYENAIVALLAS